MTLRNVSNVAQTGYVGKNLLATTFAMSRFELVEAIVSPEKSSSDAGIGGYATWTKETDLVQLWRKFVRAMRKYARQTTREVDERERRD